MPADVMTFQLFHQTCQEQRFWNNQNLSYSEWNNVYVYLT